MNHNSYKNGRTKREYWMLLRCEHHYPIKNYIQEHVYFYESYHKCCLLKWGVVHHIDENKENNMIWNLQGMMERDHLRLHRKGNRFRRGRHIDTSNRTCHNCGSSQTYIFRSFSHNNKTPYPEWRHLPWDKINWYCKKCYCKLKS